MFGILENGVLKEMPSSGVDENGCQYVVDPEHAYDYASKNGYKEIIETPCPDDGVSYVAAYTDGEVISQSWVPSESSEAE